MAAVGYESLQGIDIFVTVQCTTSTYSSVTGMFSITATCLYVYEIFLSLENHSMIQLDGVHFVHMCSNELIYSYVRE